MTHYSLRNKKYIIISCIVMIILWEVIAVLVDNKLLLPSAIDTLLDIINIVSEKNFLLLIFSSILRSIESFFVSIVLAIILATISYYNKLVYNLIFPIIIIIKAVPTMAFIVLLLIWTSKDFAPIVIGILISFPLFYDTVLNTLVNFDEKILYMCKIYKISKLNKMKNVIMPKVIIELRKVLSSTLSLIFKVVISGEIYAQPKYGIGAIIQLEKMQLNTSAVIAWILIVTLISYGVDLILTFASKDFRKGRGQLC